MDSRLQDIALPASHWIERKEALHGVILFISTKYITTIGLRYDKSQAVRP